jgi:hypothetical protein
MPFRRAQNSCLVAIRNRVEIERDFQIQRIRVDTACVSRKILPVRKTAKHERLYATILILKLNCKDETQVQPQHYFISSSSFVPLRRCNSDSLVDNFHNRRSVIFIYLSTNDVKQVVNDALSISTLSPPRPPPATHHLYTSLQHERHQFTLACLRPHLAAIQTVYLVSVLLHRLPGEAAVCPQVQRTTTLPSHRAARACLHSHPPLAPPARP